MMNISLNSIRLGLNLFALPVFLLICSLCAASFTTFLSSQPYLLTIATAIDWLVTGMLLLSVLLLISSCWKLLNAFRGKGENCHSCGMPTKLIDPGRYGPHYRCMACGISRKAHYQ